jgi:hypothetical protein
LYSLLIRRGGIALTGSQAIIQRIVLILTVMLALYCTLAGRAFAAATEITAPAGTQAHAFSIDLAINESEPYAGIQFGLTLSDEDALEFVSFTQSDSTRGASAYPVVYAHGAHSFGFWRGSNAFQGNITVGTLNFIYTGSGPQTVTITEMLVARIVGNNPVGERKDASALPVIRVSRSGVAGNDDTSGNGTGNPGSDGGTGNPGSDGDTSGETGDSGDSNGETSGNPISGTGGASGGSVNPVVVIGEEEAPLANIETKSKYFDDAPEKDWPWAVDAIDYLYEAGVVNGTAPRTYTPAAPITRGDFMLMLVRAFDLKATTAGNFQDVAPDSYYYDAIAIAKILGIAKGDGLNFNPGASITRQDAMVLTARTLQSVGSPLPAASQSVLSPFPDNAKIAEYAKDAVAALVQSGIITGDGTGINPLGNTSRAEMAVILYRILTLG